jgi:hypothetical protein
MPNEDRDHGVGTRASADADGVGRDGARPGWRQLRRLRWIEKVLVGLEGFLGLSALGGGINYVLDPQQG